jgi:hypothetical protein
VSAARFRPSHEKSRRKRPLACVPGAPVWPRSASWRAHILYSRHPHVGGRCGAPHRRCPEGREEVAGRMAQALAERVLAMPAVRAALLVREEGPARNRAGGRTCRARPRGSRRRSASCATGGRRTRVVAGHPMKAISRSWSGISSTSACGTRSSSAASRRRTTRCDGYEGPTSARSSTPSMCRGPSPRLAEGRLRHSSSSRTTEAKSRASASRALCAGLAATKWTAADYRRAIAKYEPQGATAWTTPSPRASSRHSAPNSWTTSASRRDGGSELAALLEANGTW